MRGVGGISLSPLLPRQRAECAHLFEPLARLFLEARQQGEDEGLCRRAEFLLQGEVEALKDAEHDGLHARRRVLEEGEQAAAPCGEVAAEVVGLRRGRMRSSARAAGLKEAEEKESERTPMVVRMWV